MKNIKRIAALAGVVILLSLYVLTMVFAVRKDEAARGLFFASLYATVFVPVFLFLIGYVAKLLRSRQDRKSPVVDTVVFDLGKVLIAFPWEDCVKSLHLSEPEERFLREHVYESVYWHNLDLGEMTLEEAIRAVTDTAPQYADAIRMLREQHGLFVTVGKRKAVPVEQIPAGKRVALLLSGSDAYSPSLLAVSDIVCDPGLDCSDPTVLGEAASIIMYACRNLKGEQ